MLLACKHSRVPHPSGLPTQGFDELGNRRLNGGDSFAAQLTLSKSPRVLALPATPLCPAAPCPHSLQEGVGEKAVGGDASTPWCSHVYMGSVPESHEAEAEERHADDAEAEEVVVEVDVQDLGDGCYRCR